jgi:hypothetical protein
MYTPQIVDLHCIMHRYAGFRDLAVHIIVEHLRLEQVNARGGLNHSPLLAALHKRHFDVAELLQQHDVPNITGCCNRALLHVASRDGLLDVTRWSVTHSTMAQMRNSEQDNRWTPINIARSEHSVRINAPNEADHTPLHCASNDGHVTYTWFLICLCLWSGVQGHHLPTVLTSSRHPSLYLHLEMCFKCCRISTQTLQT